MPQGSEILEKHDFGLQKKTRAVLALIASEPRLFARQGAVVATHRRAGGRTYGPYYHLKYRQAGRHRSIYLGPAGLLVEQVRQALAALQEPVRQGKIADRMCREAAASFRAARRGLNGALGSLGLRLQGAEVRGWRSSPMRSLLREAKELL